MMNRIEIDFPPLPSSDYHWDYAFTTDNSEYYPDLVDYQDPIMLGKCNPDVRYVYDRKWEVRCRYEECATVTMGALSFRILQSFL